MFRKGDIVKVVKHYMPEACSSPIPPIGSVGIVIGVSEGHVPTLNTKIAWYISDPKWESMMYDQELEKLGEKNDDAP